MKMLQRYKTIFSDYLVADHGNSKAITIFCKSLYIFLLIKMFFMRDVLPDMLNNARFIGYNQLTVYLFLSAMVVAILSGIVLKVNYVSSFLIFIFSFSLSRSTFLVANGSDFVLNLFLFLSIPFGKVPHFQNLTLNGGLLILRNFSFLFCRVQLALIYLLSGFDKLTSEAWRSGGALFSIMNLDYYFNPLLTISLSNRWFIIFSWCIILFELSFALMIWVKKTRAVILFLGIFFHLGIVFFLSLPDFGTVMILLYSLFIPYEKLFKPATVTSYGS